MLRPSLRTTAPFLLCALVGIGTLALPPYDTRPWQWLVVVPLVGAGVVLHTVALHRDHRSWVDPAAAYLFLGIVVVLRDGSDGGTTSGLAPLLVLPVLWLAIYGTRRDLVGIAAVTATAFVVPVVAVGAPAYPASDWRRGVLWIAIALVVAPVVQRVVASWQEELHRQQSTAARLRSVTDGAVLSSLVTTDLDGTITTFGVGAELLLGFRAGAVVGRPVVGVLHDPDEVAEVAAELGVEPGFAVFAALAGRTAPSRIWTYVRADGDRIAVRLALTELRDEDGVLTGYLGLAVDVTEAIRAQDELARTEQRLRVFMEHLPDTTVLVVDADLRVDLVTGAGALRHGLLGAADRPLREVAGANATILEGMVRAALRGEEGIAELNATNTGAAHEVLVTPLPSDGRPEALVLARDVSRDRERELELRRAKDRAERMFADAPQGVALLSIDGSVRQVNPALCTLLDRTEDEMLGRGLSSFGDNPLDRAVARHLHDLTSGASGPSVVEWTARTPEGRRVFVTLSSTVLRSVDDEDLILVNVTDVSDRHGFEEQLAHLADHDPLTGLANRRRFDAELTRHLDYCQRYGPIGAVVMLDLDHFKEVNDTLGHGAGDELIVAMAEVLGRGVRGTDVVARLGGDEFAVLLPQADRTGAEIVAQGIVERVRGHVRTLEGSMRKVTASVGVVVIDRANEDPSELMAAADMTMYDAKEAGRDGYAVLDYAAYQQPRTGARMEWQNRIENAIENDLLVLHLQPILDLATDTVTGAEVLVRMVDGDEVVPPSRFLPIAERTGQIVDLDCWVIEHSIALLRDIRAVDPDFRLEVNVSGRSIGHPALERAVLGALDEHGVAADGLVLEITETSAVADVETARRFAERMARAGCEFALDDFGAGFGSFYYLKHLDFDYVKIDGEFVANVHANPADRLILNSIVGVARGLGKKTVAEFVGEQAVLDVVRAEGVDLAQGYFVGMPVPVADFLATLARPDVGEAAL
ncbi:MAG: sensor domain-containing protein [Nocardioidaceae bacterium]